MKKGLYAASLVLIFSLLAIPSVLAKPKAERGNANINYNVDPNVLVDNSNLSGNNIRSNTGGRLRGQERAAYVHCLNAAKKNREFTGMNNCSRNQVYGQSSNNVQQLVPNNLPVNVNSSVNVEKE
ncbi:hypothetical protein [Calothrix sp. NIES-2098]|uniref:hypothetical protein n=1 Tax=Calothrix sp. NIES-2098 TaxID=1954171 RepID=UPI000B61F84B|nr:hypothetical protein NIES2098_53530 [Calothrix sp. NIES-2098]